MALLGDFYGRSATDSLIAGAKSRVNHTGTQSADTLVDGTTNKAFLASERTKLAGIAAGATANRADAATDAAIQAAVTALVNGSPAALDTLKELSDALGGDAAFATTVTTALGQRLRTWQPSTAYTSGQIVLNPSGIVVSANSGFTSGGSYNPTNWTVLNAALVATNTLAATGTMVASRVNILDATTGAFTANLPTPTYIGQQISFERVDAGTNLISIGGTVRGVASAISLPGAGVAGESFVLVAESLTSWRIAASHKPNALLTAMLTLVQPNPQTASYTLALADAMKAVEVTSSSATVVTIPTNASIAFPIGAVIEIFQAGTGQVTVTPAAGVTLRNPTAAATTRAQWSTVTLRKRGTDEWVIAGDLT